MVMPVCLPGRVFVLLSREADFKGISIDQPKKTAGLAGYRLAESEKVACGGGQSVLFGNFTAG
jgi:hypothetical protein